MIRSLEIFSVRALKYVRAPWGERLFEQLTNSGPRRLTAVNPEEWTRHMRRDVGLPDFGPRERPLLPSQMALLWQGWRK
jgi:hypothetical protein